MRLVPLSYWELLIQQIEGGKLLVFPPVRISESSWGLGALPALISSLALDGQGRVSWREQILKVWNTYRDPEQIKHELTSHPAVVAAWCCSPTRFTGPLGSRRC